MGQPRAFYALANARAFLDPDVLARTLADDLAQYIRAAVAARGECHFVFPGGRSPRRVLELMRGYDLPWQSLHLYPSDERCVPVGDPERNDRLIDELLVDQLTLPPANLHRIPAELGPEMGATQFSRLLRKTPPFDVVFLSAGPDGHTASLFPGHSVLADERSVVPVWGAPKPPPQRVSIGYSRLLAARQRIVMVTGSEKRELVEQVQRGVDLPVTRVQPTGWYLDGEAARVLRDNTENKISEMKGILL